MWDVGVLSVGCANSPTVNINCNTALVDEVGNCQNIDVTKAHNSIKRGAVDIHIAPVIFGNLARNQHTQTHCAGPVSL